jgi:diaminohydroxyphosphoribosylaminopyrimidine deaminase/5-amino-6-(5-phosphoribosylamino)uracil reductase
MQRAVALAYSAVGLSDPNPRVGCVILSAQGDTLGEGHTQQAGGPHAEVMALRDARSRGHDLRGATAYVTLEPCSHHGRTPPCADALVEAGIARVVVAVADPNPLVCGRGVERLRVAGIRVEVGLEFEAATELNIGFFSRMQRGRPWVRMKIAGSLDGRTALPDGRSQWITGVAARIDGHAWRRRAGAILTGIGTVLADDPRLDVRLVHTQRQPLRVVLDRQLRTPREARLLEPPGQVLIVHAPDLPVDSTAAPWPDFVRRLPLGHDPASLLAELSQREGINELHVEAGARLNAALLQAGLVDELLLYQAPCLIGPGLPLADVPLLSNLQQASRWHFVDIRQLGEDLCLRLRRPLAHLDPNP